MPVTAKQRQHARFPTAAGILIGLGVGGFFDGIIFHQVLQLHHMLTSAGFPPNSVDNLKINTLWDGFFHVATYVFVIAGLVLLWRGTNAQHLSWSSKAFTGTILIGWGLFNLVEGVIDHHILGIHHVNELVPQTQWIYWDLGFLLWGAVMLASGRALFRRGRREMTNVTKA